MADGNKLLPPARLTASGLPVLHPGEIVSILVSSVDLLFEENPNFPHLKSGILNLTNHRLLWLPHSTPGEPIYIPLATISHIFSPKKSMFSSPRIRFQVSVSSDGKVDRKGVSSVVVTLILRDKKSDPEVFLGKFWEALKGKDWEESELVEGKDRAMSSSGQRSGSTGGEGSLAVRTPMVGVSGILRKEQEMWESTDKSLQDAFQDLNALMSKAKEMVMLAEKMRSKLLSGSSTQAGGTTEDELGTKEEMQDWLLSVGIASPVTKESAGALYHQQLSRQLADYVKNKLEKAGGTLNLIDVYCMFNRARGTELISPDDLLQACSLWEKLDVPVMLRKFDSGVRVIQNKTHSDDEVFSRIRSLVTKPDALGSGISASDAAMALGVAPAMAKEYLLTAEGKGLLCRDISPDGFRFFINMFSEINIDNLYLVRDYSFYAAWINTLSTSR